MEYARCPLPKAPSSTLSATAKEETMPDHCEDHTHNIKENVNEVKAAVDVPQPSLERSRSTKNVDVSEVTPESMSVREPASQGSAPLAEEEVQQNLPGSDPGKKKKKKKVRVPANGKAVANGSADWTEALDVISLGSPEQVVYLLRVKYCISDPRYYLDLRA